MKCEEVEKELEMLLKGLDPIFKKIGDFMYAIEEENRQLEAENKTWKEAVGTVKSYYPEKVFPPDSKSSDATHGTMARETCDNIVNKQKELMEDIKEI